MLAIKEIPNLGEHHLRAMTNEYNHADLIYQIAEVSRPLTAVSSTCDRGNLVVFGSKGGLILNLATGTTTALKRTGGLYELDLWLRSEDVEAQGFTRQGV